jgi:hypothetical protein
LGGEFLDPADGAFGGLSHGELDVGIRDDLAQLGDVHGFEEVEPAGDVADHDDGFAGGAGAGDVFERFEWACCFHAVCGFGVAADLEVRGPLFGFFAVFLGFVGAHSEGDDFEGVFVLADAAEEGDLGVVELVEGAEVGFFVGADELGVGEPGLFTGGFRARELAVAGNLDLEEDFFGVVKLDGGGLVVFDVAEWSFVGAFVVGAEEVVVAGVGDGADLALDVGEFDFGLGVLGEQVLGGGELDGFDLSFGGFEDGVEGGEAGQEFVKSVVL